jgi:uncharacterized protein DUF6544
MAATTDRPGVAAGRPLRTAIEHVHHIPDWAPRRARMMAHTLRPAAASDPATFHAGMLDGFPEPAQRWLAHAIRPGAPLARRAALHMHGEIRLGRHWHEFTANQLLMPDAGFVWAARTHVGHLPVSGFDAYAGGVGVMRWRLLGLPVQADTGADVTLSSLDRLAAEATLLPMSLLGASWRPGTEPDTAVYAHHVSGRHARAHVTIRVAPDGRLLEVRMRRWAAPEGKHYRLHTFVVSFDGEFDAGTMLVPDGIHAAWTDAGGEFFRASLDSVTLE